MSLLPYVFDKHFHALLHVDDFLHLPCSARKFVAPIRNQLNATTAHEFNATMKSNKDKFQVNLDVQHFEPEEITVKTVDGYVVVEGEHEEKMDEHGFVSRKFVRRYTLPEGCLPDMVESSLSSDGVLTVTAPKVVALPDEGERIVPIITTGPVRRLQAAP